MRSLSLLIFFSLQNGKFPEVSEFTATSHSRNVVHSLHQSLKDIRELVLRLIMPMEFTLPSVIMEAEGTSIYLQQMCSIREGEWHECSLGHKQ